MLFLLSAVVTHESECGIYGLAPDTQPFHRGSWGSAARRAPVLLHDFPSRATIAHPHSYTTPPIITPLLLGAPWVGQNGVPSSSVPEQLENLSHFGPRQFGKLGYNGQCISLPPFHQRTLLRRAKMFAENESSPTGSSGETNIDSVRMREPHGCYGF